MSELSSDALQLLVNLAREPKRVELIPIPDKRRYALFNADSGMVTFETTEPPSRAHTINSVDTIISEAKRLKVSLNPVVWVHYGSIIVLDDDARRDKSTLTFGKSAQFKLLETLYAHIRGIPQKQFIRMLRVDLDGCLGTTGNFLSLVRQLKFTAGQDATGTVQHGKESISRSTISELIGADAIPEEITLSVRVYNLPAEPARPVRCAVEIDVQTSTFSLTPFPSQLEDAERAAIAAIRDHVVSELEGEDIAVVFGTP